MYCHENKIYLSFKYHESGRISGAHNHIFDSKGKLEKHKDLNELVKKAIRHHYSKEDDNVLMSLYHEIKKELSKNTLNPIHERTLNIALEALATENKNVMRVILADEASRTGNTWPLIRFDADLRTVCKNHEIEKLLESNEYKKIVVQAKKEMGSYKNNAPDDITRKAISLVLLNIYSNMQTLKCLTKDECKSLQTHCKGIDSSPLDYLEKLELLDKALEYAKIDHVRNEKTSLLSNIPSDVYNSILLAQ